MSDNLINGGVSVERGRMSRPKYIAALEKANRALCRENKRLVRMMMQKMQDIMIVPKGRQNTFTIYINTERK